MIDPRIISGLAFFLIGALLLIFVAKVKLTHPINHAFLVGTLVTAEGYKIVQRNLYTIIAVAAFFIAAALAKFAYAARWKGGTGGGAADFFGIIEAMFAVWAAGCVSVAAWRLWQKR